MLTSRKGRIGQSSMPWVVLVIALVFDTLSLASRDLKKWVGSPMLMITIFLRPILWVLLFGLVINGAFFSNPSSEQLAALEGAPNYFSFLAVGMLSVMVVMDSATAAVSLTLDRFTGFLNKLLVAPISRETILFSKIVASAVRGLAQVVALLVVALILGLAGAGSFNWVTIAGSLFGIFLLSVGLSGIFLLLSLRFRRWEEQQATLTIANLPLMFTSNIFYPISRMPVWLQPLASLNPLSYSAQLSRTLFFGANSAVFAPSPLVNLAVLFVFATVSIVFLVLLSRRWLAD